MNMESIGCGEKSIVKSPDEQQFLSLCEPLLQNQNLRVVDIDFRKGHRSLLRIFVEKMGDHASPSLEDCARASRTIGAELDATDVIPGAYDLEVSSPGLDCRLRLRSDFDRVLGGEVKLRLVEQQPGLGANARGRLIEVGDSGIRLEVSGQVHAVPFESIKQANRVWRF